MVVAFLFVGNLLNIKSNKILSFMLYLNYIEDPGVQAGSHQETDAIKASINIVKLLKRA